MELREIQFAEKWRLSHWDFLDEPIAKVSRIIAAPPKDGDAFAYIIGQRVKVAGQWQTVTERAHGTESNSYFVTGLGWVSEPELQWLADPNATEEVAKRRDKKSKKWFIHVQWGDGDEEILGPETYAGAEMAVKLAKAAPVGAECDTFHEDDY